MRATSDTRATLPGSRETSARPDAITLACFAALVLVAGGNPVGVRFSNRELAPFWGAGLRFGVASILLLALARARRLALPRGRALAGTLLFGFLACFAFFALVYVAFTHVPASLGAPNFASMPLLTFFFALAHRLEPFRWRGLIGASASVAGIAVLSSAGGSSSAPIKYLLLILAASACAAEASIVVKKFPKVHPIMMNAIGMLMSSMLFLAISFTRSEAHTLPHRRAGWLALGYLVLFGSCVTFLLIVTVINRLTATASSYYFVLFPIVSVLLAAWIAKEPLTASIASGGALVLIGVYIGALSGRHHAHHGKKPAVEPAPCPSC
ncbi:MAG: DMT family transporter [Actinomycetota bacterium]